MYPKVLYAKRAVLLTLIGVFVLALVQVRASSSAADLPDLIRQAKNPGPLYRPVPLWWWDGDKLEPERLRWQLDQLHEKGVDQVCVIYLAPLWSQPPYFTEQWWDLYQDMVDYAASLGMKVWLTDGVAWGSPFINNSVLEVNPDFRGQLLEQQETIASGPGRIRHEIPQGYQVTDVLGAFAYRRNGEGIDLEERHNLTSLLDGRKLVWEAPAGEWLVMIFYTKPMGFQGNLDLGFGRGYGIDYTNPAAMDALIGLTTGEYAKRVSSHIGKTVAGTFQDELVTHHHYGFPPYSKSFSKEFEKRKGYDIRPRLGALFYDAGKLTDKVRCDYFEVLVELFEEAFYKPYFQWHEDRNMLIAHDQYGRMDLIAQTWGYGDYFRTQSWFQVPGYDDWSQAVPGRNWRDAKLAASIAQLYDRSRVWVEALHSSGWGLDLQEQVLALNENYIYGANIYDKHGFDYSTYGSWYNWAPPSAHYRMPYWMHYRPFADYVTRMSFMQSQGEHVADVGVFYPVHTIQANYSAKDGANDRAAVTEAYFWRAGRHLLDRQTDFHFINDQSIQKASVGNGRISISGVEFSTLVLPPLTTVDRRTLEKIEEFVSNGGLLVSLAAAPRASTQSGRDDPNVLSAVERIFGTQEPDRRLEKEHPEGGRAVFLPADVSEISKLIRAQRPVDFETDAGSLMYQHRRAGEMDFYLLYNRSSKEIETSVKLRASGSPFKFDSVNGQTSSLYTYRQRGKYTELKLKFAPYEAYHVYFVRNNSTPSLAESSLDEIEKVTQQDGQLLISGWHRSSSTVEVKTKNGAQAQKNVDPVEAINLSGTWESELQPTLDNQWGDFRRPPSDEFIGPEVRQFRYRMEGTTADGQALGWHRPEFDDSEWPVYSASVGPYWWALGPIPNRGAEGPVLTEYGPEAGVDPERVYKIQGQEYRWRPYEFSMRFGLEKDPDYFRALGSKKQANPTFLELGQADYFGLIYLATNIYSPRSTQAVLMSSTSEYWGVHRIWLNGEVVSDTYHRDRSGQFGSLIPIHLNRGWNTVLIKSNQRHRSVQLTVYVVEQKKALHPDSKKPRQGPPQLERLADTDFIYDIYRDGRQRVGWYRFPLPPGTRSFTLHVEGEAEVYVEGQKQRYDRETGQVRLKAPLEQGGLAALRVEHEIGKYGGAAVPETVKIETGKGRIRLGDWSKQGLLNYSGAVVYRKDFHIPADFAGKRIILDLGKVDASTSVRVNGREAGVRGWLPYRFDITEAAHPGENSLEVTVANALGNHYLTGTPAVHVYEGQTESGLFGPVSILPYTAVELTVPVR